MSVCPFLQFCRKIHPTHRIPDSVCEKQQLRQTCEDYCFAVLVNNRVVETVVGILHQHLGPINDNTGIPNHGRNSIKGLEMEVP